MGSRGGTALRFILDTHILIWWLEDGSRLGKEQADVLRAARSGRSLLLSDISLWEVATLANLGRLQLSMPLREWLERATAAPLIECRRISPAVAAQVASLPDHFHRDPADRIIVSTAILENATLLTADRRIIDSGLVPTI